MTAPGPAARVAMAAAEEARVLLTTFAYFTRLPVPASIAANAQRLGSAGRYLPIVGLVVGGIGAAVYLAARLYLPLSVAVLLSMTATLLATGALHEDGLADCCDGLGGTRDRRDALRIMKDSRIGAFGAIGLVVALAMRWQALLAIATVAPRGAALWMIAAQAASRAGAVVYLTWLDYARVDGKAQPFARQPWPSAAIALALGLPWLFWYDAQLGLLVVAIGMALHVWLGQWFVRRLGGYTGDCLGLAQQVLEMTIYLVVLGWICS